MALNCYIAKLLVHETEKCISDSYTQNNTLKNIDSFSKDDLKYLSYRVPGFKIDCNDVICTHHADKYLRHYSMKQKKCCDPFNKHAVNVKIHLNVLSLQDCESFEKILNIRLIPGQKICRNCYRKIKTAILNYGKQNNYCRDPFKRHRNPVNNFLKIVDENISVKFAVACSDIELLSGVTVCSSCYNRIQSIVSEFETQQNIKSDVKATATQSSESNSESLASLQNSENFISTSQNAKNLDSLYAMFNISPIDKNKLTLDRLKNKALDALQCIVGEITTTMCKVYDIELPNFSNLNEIHQDSVAFKAFIKNSVNYYNLASNTNEKIKILSLMPYDWSYKMVNQYFDCSRYFYNEVVKLRENEGPMSRSRKLYTRVPDEVKKEIIEYYKNDCNSRPCSGMKECVMQKVPNAKSIPVPKRLLMYDTRDLYNNWLQEKTCEEKPCFSFFASLRPKECVSAGSPGTHTVCVCELHQNVKLRLSAWNRKINYRLLIDEAVCSIDNKNCMLHQTCTMCPGRNAIFQYLSNAQDNLSILSTCICFKKWETIKTSAGKEGAQFSKTVLNDLEEPRDEFLNKLVEDIYKLMPHHFVSENQKIFLKACKSNLDKNTCLILMDFSENFAFICQDSTQGYYYNNSQATVHPFAVYYKDEASEELKILNFCVISDCTKHTAVAINIFQERVLEKLKELLPWIKNIIYFSDGAPTQYKNKNHFINLCHHEEDFRFKVISHNFSETSHGKNVCDGIGATVKKLTRRASLQRPINNQIQTARQMFDYCQDNISGIRFLYVNQQDVEARDRKLHSRFQAARRISDTRIHHYFEPISQSRMKIKIFSADDEFALVNIA